MNIDAAISLLIASGCRNVVFDLFSIFFSVFFSFAFFPLVLIILHQTKKKISTMLIALLFNFIIVNVVKFIVQRPRPFFIQSNPIFLASSYSFPSGHASIAFVFAVFFSNFYPKYKYIFYLIAIAVSLSRVYLGVHYLSDVIAGAIIGFIVSKFVIEREKKIDAILKKFYLG
ncbi:MAG: phosphatase PAP2 family protein [Candidatus Parvarchaeota archaeon]|nr:phosphatase PAP2 family protein [Candidatus Jingweiarchaeum tengchongense]MCW1298088.1 phosphatase PAP2 family protein [Candidatus Jingweiarchaeum tengchongense]MCW1300797.1 phosphatase PAP2 family protein [Candidatus Jingweiarchaeum tengchongense]MCW1304930.1 phosphatase PAP2 family protein [Candidatus Jingweiarchaeum tengchongense]MCW1305510.1 phosphatase PAP2 family protein [Candidatus Jingweiarchaeum tengchongense]